jgi:RNA polymerase sigma-70 factor (ECF subfamily)
MLLSNVKARRGSPIGLRGRRPQLDEEAKVESLSGAFLRQRADARPGAIACDSDLRLERELSSAFDAGVQNWPTLRISGPSFARFLGDLLAGEEGDLAESLSQRHVADLFLVCGCLLGDAAALRAFDKSFLAGIDRWVRVVGVADRTDEVRQILREKLLVAHGPIRPKLASYTGRGRLASWLSVAAQRAALSLNRHESARPEPLSLDALENAVAVQPDADLTYLRSRCEPHLREAFRLALLGLSTRDRLVLRLRLIDDLNLEQIGRMYDVNASTVSRWLNAIRSSIREQVERTVAEGLGLNSNESLSLAALVASDLEISLAQLLA